MNNINDIIFKGRLRSIQNTVSSINELNILIKEYLPSPLNNQCFVANIRENIVVIGAIDASKLQVAKNSYFEILELFQKKQKNISALKFTVII
jgi:hypothetical protein